MASFFLLQKIGQPIRHPSVASRAELEDGIASDALSAVESAGTESCTS
jgi:hypothetical protein